MNFFGHAAFAAFAKQPEREEGVDAAFTLGAMLPDFCGMLGVSHFGSAPGSVHAGVRFHHVTDNAFHEHPGFVALATSASRELQLAGVAKGPARAVGHIGIEILLDERFADRAEARAGYLAALRFDLVAEVSPHERAAARRVAELQAALLERGVPDAVVAPELVARRIRRALGGRRRLELDDAGEARVIDWVVRGRSAVAQAAPALVGDLTLQLSGPLRELTTGGGRLLAE